MNEYTALAYVIIAALFMVLSFISGYSSGVAYGRKNILTVLRLSKHKFVHEWLARHGDQEDEDLLNNPNNKLINFKHEGNVKMVLNR